MPQKKNKAAIEGLVESHRGTSAQIVMMKPRRMDIGQKLAYV